MDSSSIQGQVKIVAGLPRAGKAPRLLAEFREFLANRQSPAFLSQATLPAGQMPQGLWICPSQHNLESLRCGLLRDGDRAYLGPQMLTFARFAEGLIAGSGQRIRPVSILQRRRMLQRVIETVVSRGELKHLSGVAHTPGFVEQVDQQIAELKRRDIWPDEYVRLAQTQREQDLGHLYAAYQQQLQAGDLYDTEGRFWAAREIIASRAASPAHRYGLVVVAGFRDFTAAQYDILRLLASQTDSLQITLTCEEQGEGTPGTASPAGRGLLFSKTYGTLARLQELLPGSELECVAAPPLAVPALEYLRSRLFEDETSPPGIEGPISGLEILAAQSVQGECEEVALRIKRLLLDGKTRPAQILVILSGQPEIAWRMGEVLGDFGIPHFLETPRGLAAAPLVRLIQGLLRLQLEDWPFSQLLGVVGNRLIGMFDSQDIGSPDTNQTRLAIENCLRAAQLPTGRKALLDQCQRWSLAADAAMTSGAQEEEIPQLYWHALVAGSKLEQLGACLDALPQEAVLHDWLTALEKMLVVLEVIPANKGVVDEQDAETLSRHQKNLSPESATGGGMEADKKSPTQNPVGNAHCDAASAMKNPEWHEAPFSPTRKQTGSKELIQSWQLLRRGLRAIEVADLGTGDVQLHRLEAILSLIDFVARNTRLHQGQDATGRVRVLTTDSARHVTAQHVFMVGLSEQSFSSREPELQHPESMADSAFSRSAAAAVPGQKPAAGGWQEEDGGRLSRSSESMLMFYELVTRATSSLTLSYPAIDEKGQPLPPSPMLVELQRCLGEATIPTTTMTLGQPQDSSSPPHSLSTFRQQALGEALEGRHGWLAGLAGFSTTQSAGGSILAGLRSISQRAEREGFGPYEGLLLNESVQSVLARRFDKDHLWSPSQLEGYATCPFRFYAEHLLHLQPVGELTLRSDAARRGSLLHQVLAAVHQQLSTSHQEGDADRLLVDRLLQTLQAVVSANPLGGVEQALREIERREIAEWVPDYVGQEQDYRSQWGQWEQPPQPTYFEVRFGPKARTDLQEGADSTSTLVPFEIDLGSEKIRLIGQIDRIDIGRVGGVTVFNIIDYKSGKHAIKMDLKKVHSGHQLQLPLYALAAEKHLLADQQARAFAAGYWNVRDKGFEKKGKQVGFALSEVQDETLAPCVEWEELQPALMERVTQTIRSIRRGHFPVYNEDNHCTNSCPYRSVCRIGQIRSLEKVWIEEDSGVLKDEEQESRGN